VRRGMEGEWNVEFVGGVRKGGLEWIVMTQGGAD
jgi:hypothetical protein